MYIFLLKICEVNVKSDLTIQNLDNNDYILSKHNLLISFLTTIFQL
jgi:hypothetical protein